MRLKSAIVPPVFLAALLLASLAWGQTPPTAEVRTYLGETDAAGIVTDDDTHRWNMTALRRGYVCPECGWSSDRLVDWNGNAIVCPDYHSHGGGPTALVPRSYLERIVDGVQRLSGDVARCDAHYRDPAGADHYWYLMGRPYRPNEERYELDGTPTLANLTPRSRVFCEVRGLADTTSGDALPGGPGNGDRVRFLCIPPGVKEPMARAYYSTALADMAMQSEADYSVNWNAVSPGDFDDFTAVGIAAGSPIYADPDGVPNSGDETGYFEIAVNPHRVSSDDRYYVRYSSINDALNTTQGWRLEVYSKIHGLELDVIEDGDTAPAEDTEFLTYSGAVRLTLMRDLPSDSEPANSLPAAWGFTFRIMSNCRIIPGGALRDNRDLATDWDPSDTAADAIPTASLHNLSWSSWRYDGLHYRINGGVGAGSATDTQDVYRGDNADPGGVNDYPFVIQPGEIGIGRVEVQWASQQPDNTVPTVSEHTLSGGATLYYAATGQNCQWWYDRYGQGSNDGVATGTTPPAWPLGQQYSPIEGRFVSSRYSIEPTDETYRHGDVEPARATLPEAAYPRYVLDSVMGGARDGALRPGESTERRVVALTNAHEDTARLQMSRCPTEAGGCGAVFTNWGGTAIPAFPEPPHLDNTGTPVPGDSCPYCGMAVARWSTGARWEGLPDEGEYVSYAPEGAVGQPLAAPEKGAAPWSAAFPAMRPRIPSEAVQFGMPQEAVPVGGSVPFWVRLAVPQNQPSSQPGDTGSNTLNDNYGYRGWATVYHPAGMLNPYERDRSYDDNDRWDAYMVCPDCGQPQSAHGEVCPTCGRWYPAGTGTCAIDATPLVSGAYPGSPHGVQCSNTSCRGHQFCPLCGCVWGPDLDGDGDVTDDEGCPFCGYAGDAGLHLIRVGPQSTEPNPTAPAEVADYADGTGAGATPLWYKCNVGQRDLWAEEYEPFDLQVTVEKAVGLAGDTPSTDLGRVAPGTNMLAPDLTTGALTGTLRADPANASRWGGFSVDNSGNTVPELVGLLPGAAGISDAWYRLLRPEAGALGRGYGWGSVRDAISASLKDPNYESVYRTAIADPTTETLLPLSGTPGLPWRPLYPLAGSVDGGQAEGIVRVGLPGGAAGDVVPNGQVLGRYTAPMVYYQDLNGNGVFDYVYGPGAGTATTSDVRRFNPETDTGVEPHIITYARLRVREARLPYNDYEARDTGPTPWIGYNSATGQPDGLQVFWMSDGIGGGRPSPQAPTNLRVGTAAAVGSGENRDYEWQNSFGQLTGSTGFLSQNGPVATYRDASNVQWALWPVTDRSAGGMKSGIARAHNGGGAWNAPSMIWTGQDRAQCVSGFFDPRFAGGPTTPQPAHWAFWVTGPKGQEQIMYRVDYLDPAWAPLVGVLPIDNSISPADPAQVAYTWVDTDGEGPLRDVRTAIQRVPRGPFAAIKDVQAHLYLPPTVYNTTDGGGPNEDALRGVTQPQIRVFFAGYARNRQNFDIYEARFDLWRLLSQNPDTLTGDFNRGRLVIGDRQDTHARGLPAMNPEEVANNLPGDAPPEEMECDTMSQEFTSLCPDWYAPASLLFGGGGVDLYLGIKLQGESPPIASIQYYDVTWNGATAGERAVLYGRGQRYEERRGVYRVIPRFRPHKDDPGFHPLPVEVSMQPPVPLVPEERELKDPNSEKLAAAAGDPVRPVMMEMDPALGTVRFSAPLFNRLNPADTSCVFNTQDIPGLEDVFLCAQYIPYLQRLTESPADDDCPTAIYQSGPWNGNVQTAAFPYELTGRTPNLTLFWRRRFGAGDAPYYGRTCYMMRQNSWSFQVNHPPIDAGTPPIVTAWSANCRPTTPGPEMVGPGMPTEDDDNVIDEAGQQIPAPDRPEYAIDMANGVVAIWHGAFRYEEIGGSGNWVRAEIEPGDTIAIQYVSADGNTYTERHTVGGWSEETVVPIDTVLSEGPLSAVEETYTVPSTPVAGAPELAARRYWVFWSSPRPLFDLRPAPPAGPGGGVDQSWDVYYCALVPEFPTLNRRVWTGNRIGNRFRP